jgi:hypothetical protein
MTAPEAVEVVVEVVDVGLWAEEELPNPLKNRSILTRSQPNLEMRRKDDVLGLGFCNRWLAGLLQTRRLSFTRL